MKTDWMAKYIFVSKSSTFMQIPASNFSYIHTSVISVRPQTPSMQKKTSVCQTVRSQRQWFAWKMATCDWLKVMNKQIFGPMLSTWTLPKLFMSVKLKLVLKWHNRFCHVKYFVFLDQKCGVLNVVCSRFKYILTQVNVKLRENRKTKVDSLLQWSKLVLLLW